MTLGAQLQHRAAGNLGLPEARSLTCPSLLLDKLKPGMIEQNSLRSYLQAVWLPGSTAASGNPDFLFGALRTSGPGKEAKTASCCVTQPCASHRVTSVVLCWLQAVGSPSWIQGKWVGCGRSKSHCTRARGMAANP